MDNERFINTLQACKDLSSVDSGVLERLRKSELNIQETYKRLERGFDKNSTDLDASVLLLRLIGRLDLAYQLRDDREKLIRDFFKCMELQSKIRVDKDYADIRMYIYGNSFKSLELSRDLRIFKLARVGPSQKFWLNEEEHKISVVNDNNLLIDGKGEGIGGLFIKDKKIEKGMIQEGYEDFPHLINKILYGDFDIGIIPSFIYVDRDIEYLYNMSKLDNKDYLEILLLLGDMVEGSIDTRDYWKISQSDIRYYKIISYFKAKNVTDGLILKFLSIIDDKIKKEVDKDRGRFVAKSKKKEIKIVDSLYDIIHENQFDSKGLKMFKSYIDKLEMNGVGDISIYDCIDILKTLRVKEDNKRKHWRI